MIYQALAILGAVLSLIVTPVEAHEVRPAYLEIRETGPEQYDILWKTPARGDATIRLAVVLPETCAETVPPVSTNDGAANASRWSVKCEGGLAGQEVRIAGLERTLVETIARFERSGGAAQSVRLMGGTTSFMVAEPSTILGVAAVYGVLGIDHILLGFDHLCFVLALLLLIDNVRKLIWTITAFTVAHSITLAAATLGYISAPSGPIEALIALSIALVAAEVVAKHRGQPSPTAERPWLIAFGFGLLHGLGFAGALSETGLPDDAIPVALLFFNIGVEIGQLAFVAVLLAIAAVARWFIPGRMPQAATAVAFAIGTLAAFWTIERVAGIIA
jgi:HupE/UreJ protein